MRVIRAGAEAVISLSKGDRGCIQAPLLIADKRPGSNDAGGDWFAGCVAGFWINLPAIMWPGTGVI